MSVEFDSLLEEASSTELGEPGFVFAILLPSAVPGSGGAGDGRHLLISTTGMPVSVFAFISSMADLDIFSIFLKLLTFSSTSSSFSLSVRECNSSVSVSISPPASKDVHSTSHSSQQLSNYLFLPLD